MHDNTSLHALPNDARALGLFSSSHLPVWLDRVVFQDNLKTFKSWNGTAGTPDVPGLKDMTIKAIDIISARAKAAGTGFMLMSEAASIDKQMHIADCESYLPVVHLPKLMTILVQTIEPLEMCLSSTPPSEPPFSTSRTSEKTRTLLSWLLPITATLLTLLGPWILLSYNSRRQTERRGELSESVSRPCGLLAAFVIAP